MRAGTLAKAAIRAGQTVSGKQCRKPFEEFLLDAEKAIAKMPVYRLLRGAKCRLRLCTPGTATTTTLNKESKPLCRTLQIKKLAA